MPKIVLSVKSLKKDFKRLFRPTVQAVGSVSFSVREGEIIGLLGSNGAGKTTTLQMLLGVLKPTAGSVRFFGKDFIANRSFILEKVNFASAYVNMPWLLTVQEVLIYFSHLYNIPNKTTRVTEMLSKFRLSQLKKRQVMTLSAGQLTRLNLAKAYLNQPKILFLDEPTASLDPETANFLRNFLLADRAEHNTTIILASHNMTEVMQLCDRVIFLKSGFVVADEKPEILAKKISQFKFCCQLKGKHKEFQMICEMMKVPFKRDKTQYQVMLTEAQIYTLLKKLVLAGINFSVPRIIEPNLEDLFFQVNKK